MKTHTYRTLFIVTALAFATMYIYPTVGWMTLSDETRQERLDTWEQEDLAASDSGLFGGMTKAVKRWSQFNRDWVINLGLDLQGGVHMVVEFDPNDLDGLEERELQEQDIQAMVLQRIRNRVDEFEAKEPIIQALGTNQIQIMLPGEKNVKRAQELIMKTAFLTFHLASGVNGSFDEKEQAIRDVHKHFEAKGQNFAQNLLEIARGVYRVPAENFKRVSIMVEEANGVEGLLPENRMFAFSTPPAPGGGDQSYQLYLIENDPAMNGEDLTSAVARPDDRNPGRWKILFEFGADGVANFADLTDTNRGREMAIVLDGRVVSAPTINERIVGSGEITGQFTADEAKDLSIALNSGSMPVPIKEAYSGVVDASLGADSVQKGVFSAISGLLLVMVFMLIYYRAAGIIAIIALTANALLVVGALAYFNATLTLPGIAGLILTIGMAVDANVLIFERIREELRNGKSLLSSIEGGYARATITILDANVTTLIAALVLTQFGTGPVQGFAVTLSIGVCASVFAALIVTRSVLDFVVERKIISELSMMSILKAKPDYKFIEKRKVAFTVSAAVIVVGMAMFGFRAGDMFGVDFKNGTNMRIAIASDAGVAERDVRDRLTDSGFPSAVVQAYTGTDLSVPNQFLIRIGDDADGEAQPESTEALPGGTVDTVSNRVQLALADLGSGSDINDQVRLLSVQTVGPAVGKRLRGDSYMAISWALVFIIFYLWFRFELKFAVGAAVALVHDVLVTIGVFAVFGREISIPVVAALLTIIGYSLNDTIVVFDRLREDLKLERGQGTKRESIIDLAVNHTLSRTILTSLTTLFVVVVLFVFGGGDINDFAFALIIGIIVGTYSSIFVASPAVLIYEDIQEWWQARRHSSGPGGPGKSGGSSKRKKKKARNADEATA